MALPSNVFKTIVNVVSLTDQVIYTAPIGYTGVVLLAQITNIGNNTQTVSFSHRRMVNGVEVTTEIVKNYPVSSSDTLSLLSGKLALESDDEILISGSSSTDLKFISSILETLNA